MATKEELIESIKSLSVLELSELVKALEEEFGVSAAAPVAVAAAPAAGGDGAADAAEEQFEFTVTITDVGANKINVIKTVRELTNLGLREAKELVESAPVAVRESVSKEEADDTKKKLEESGATVTVA